MAPCGSQGQYAPNFVPIGQSIAQIWPFLDCSRWRPSDILDFLKCDILTNDTVLTVNVYRHAKFGTNRIIHCVDIFLDFSRWRLSAIFVLLQAYRDHSRILLGGLYHCAKYKYKLEDTLTPRRLPAVTLTFDLHSPQYNQLNSNSIPCKFYRHCTSRS